MALVPYVENVIPALSKLQNSSAQFHFANHDVRLVQDWKKLGVAAVVWDAVSATLSLTLQLFCYVLFALNVNCVCFPGCGYVYVPGAGAGGDKGEGGH